MNLFKIKRNRWKLNYKMLKNNLKTKIKKKFKNLECNFNKIK